MVTVSDLRLSYGDMVAADDQAVMKNRKMAHGWGMMFAAEDATAFPPVIHSVYDALGWDGKQGKKHNAETVRVAVREAYEKEFNERFFREHLARFGYSDIGDFRRNGYQEMGKDLYSQYADALARFNLGLESVLSG
jgi:hypothetical protein